MGNCAIGRNYFNTAVEYASANKENVSSNLAKRVKNVSNSYSNKTPVLNGDGNEVRHKGSVEFLCALRNKAEEEVPKSLMDKVLNGGINEIDSARDFILLLYMVKMVSGKSIIKEVETDFLNMIEKSKMGGKSPFCGDLSVPAVKSFEKIKEALFGVLNNNPRALGDFIIKQILPPFIDSLIKEKDGCEVVFRESKQWLESQRNINIDNCLSSPDKLHNIFTDVTLACTLLDLIQVKPMGESIKNEPLEESDNEDLSKENLKKSDVNNSGKGDLIININNNFTFGNPVNNNFTFNNQFINNLNVNNSNIDNSTVNKNSDFDKFDYKNLISILTEVKNKGPNEYIKKDFSKRSVSIKPVLTAEIKNELDGIHHDKKLEGFLSHSMLKDKVNPAEGEISSNGFFQNPSEIAVQDDIGSDFKTTPLPPELSVKNMVDLFGGAGKFKINKKNMPNVGVSRLKKQRGNNNSNVDLNKGLTGIDDSKNNSLVKENISLFERNDFFNNEDLKSLNKKRKNSIDLKKDNRVVLTAGFNRNAGPQIPRE